MFTSIIKFFQKNKKEAEEALEFPEVLILEDINKDLIKQNIHMELQ